MTPEAPGEAGDGARAALVAAVRSGDVAGARAAFAAHPELRAMINEPAEEHFGARPLLRVVESGNREMIDVFLEAGADINGRSDWWAGSFGVLDSCRPELAPFLIERGGVVDAHAAARLGMLDRLRALIDADAALVHARGGDGQTPLHFAANVEVAALLLERGADIDARDIDHESTPAQWMLRDRQEVARFLVGRGAHTDLLMAVALGDLERVRGFLDRDPASIRTSVTATYFPKGNPRAGGHIYIWTLGLNRTALLVARDHGRAEVLRLLLERSPEPVRLTFALEQGDEVLAEALLTATPDLIRTLADEDRRRLVDAAEDENWGAVRRMLAAGWPVDVRGQHGGTALHWTAWHGEVAMVREILRYDPPLELKDDDYGGTPLTWASYASVHGWHTERGDYAGVVEALMDAGAVAPPLDQMGGSEAVRAVLRRRSGS
jgi:ankyrin repeat protein